MIIRLFPLNKKAPVETRAGNAYVCEKNKQSLMSCCFAPGVTVSADLQDW